MATPPYPLNCLKEEKHEDPTLKPRSSSASLFFPIEEGDTPHKELILSLPKETRWLPYVLRLYEGFWWWEGIIPGIIGIQQRFKARPNDILIISFPKSGTTWLKSLTFSIMNRHKYGFTNHPLLRLSPHDCVRFLELIYGQGEESYVESLTSPRLLCCHTPYSCLPDCITTSECRIVYVCRDPKDVLVSAWYMDKNYMPNVPLSFNQAFEVFCEGRSGAGPIWDHILQYWNESLRRPDKFLFLKYEEMMAEPHQNLRKLAEFIRCPFSEEEEKTGVIEQIIELCSFKNLKELDVNKKGEGFSNIENELFFRKGVVGDWKNNMSPEMAERLDEITREKLHGCGLTFSR
ncbi:hypothetical protein LUZ63_018729 [Rhynchospora breviuscula]|uniref:Sulfotransferase n=1 Tax=Rhynchospora breviuscula TaxID=2022672 RepID=A0A9Q0C4X5_9POAL|nr:hypothetical protein LUZ63_018729 [Rhynchospora breviuscula]